MKLSEILFFGAAMLLPLLGGGLLLYFVARSPRENERVPETRSGDETSGRPQGGAQNGDPR